MKNTFLLILLVLSIHPGHGYCQPLFQKQTRTRSAVSSFENLNGVKGAGAKTNRGAKGNAFEWIFPGQQKTLLDIKGQGVVQRIWLTTSLNPRVLRSLRLTMFWDNDSKAAVDIPLADFFGFTLGRPVPFESALFSSPEGRSFTCYIPMPFKKAAKIVLANESLRDSCKLFFDVDFVHTNQLPPGSLYFHAYWNRSRHTTLGNDVAVLPLIRGSGRFLGMSAGVITDSIYGTTWWGEGEVKMYIDGDQAFPSIAGTGAEDYAGTGWGMGTYSHQYQGCTFADPDNRIFSFYRWHVPDAIWFDTDLRITLQQIGGGTKKDVQTLWEKKVKLLPVTIDKPSGFVRLLDLEKTLTISDEDFPDGWVNFFRLDDYAISSYFYLDKTSTGLPGLPPLEIRTEGLK